MGTEDQLSASIVSGLPWAGKTSHQPPGTAGQMYTVMTVVSCSILEPIRMIRVTKVEFSDLSTLRTLQGFVGFVCFGGRISLLF